LSKNYCAELKISVFSIALADAQILTTTWKQKTQIFCWGSNAAISCEILLQICSFWWLSTLSSGSSYSCVSRC